MVNTRDEFNKNYNAVVDHACQEIEAEIRKLAPEGSLSLQPLQSLNAKLRRSRTLSAYKIHAARILHTGDNIRINNS